MAITSDGRIASCWLISAGLTFTRMLATSCTSRSTTRWTGLPPGPNAGVSTGGFMPATAFCGANLSRSKVLAEVTLGYRFLALERDGMGARQVERFHYWAFDEPTVLGDAVEQDRNFGNDGRNRGRAPSRSSARVALTPTSRRPS
ncbi:MAG: hypothetical protein JNK15_17455 [Planctomycetes bacterium]|nr:hypothetical protein [Planctomycetota bacterium]